MRDRTIDTCLSRPRALCLLERKEEIIMSRRKTLFLFVFSLFWGAAVYRALPVLSGHAVEGADVKVTLDNNNVDGGAPNPGFDAQNRQANETTVAISPVAPNIVAVGANDYRMVPAFADAWLGFYVSSDGGATWFNTMVPGFPTDTSANGLASPLLHLDGSGDPVVRFDGAGNLYVAGLASNRTFQPDERPTDTVVYVAKYAYTPGEPGRDEYPYLCCGSAELHLSIHDHRGSGRGGIRRSKSFWICRHLRRQKLDDRGHPPQQSVLR